MEDKRGIYEVLIINTSQTLKMGPTSMFQLVSRLRIFLKLILTFIQVSSFYSESAKIFNLESYILFRVVNNVWYTLGF